MPIYLFVGGVFVWSGSEVEPGGQAYMVRHWGATRSLFALVLHLLVHTIRDNYKFLHAWYLDDGTVIGDTEEVAKVLGIIQESGPELGLKLNIRKTELFWPSCDGRKLREGLFPVDIGRPVLEVKLLGGDVSRDDGFIKGRP